MSSKTQDEVQQLQALTALEEFLRKSELLQGLVPSDKQIGLWNAFVKNSKVENPEDLALDDKEIQQAAQQAQNKLPSPRENVITNYKDLPEDIKRQQEQELGFQPSQGMSPAEQQVQGSQQTTEENPITPDHILKADAQAHDQEIDKAKLKLEAAKIAIQAKQAATQAKVAAKPTPRPVAKSTAKKKGK